MECDFILFLLEEMKCLRQVKSKSFGKSFTVIPVFNPFGVTAMCKQKHRTDQFFLFWTKVVLYCIHKCWKMMMSNFKLLERIICNISKYVISHRKPAVAAISGRINSYFLCMCLRWKHQNQQEWLRRLIELAPLWYCILPSTFIPTIHCSFWRGSGDQVQQTKILHYQTNITKNCSKMQCTYFLYIVGIIVIFSMNSSLWGLYEL